MEIHNPTTHQKGGTIFISYYGLPRPMFEAYTNMSGMDDNNGFKKDYSEYKASKTTVPLKEEYKGNFKTILFDSLSFHYWSDFEKELEKGISIESIKSRIKIVPDNSPLSNQANAFEPQKYFAILTPIAVEEEWKTQNKQLHDFLNYLIEYNVNVHFISEKNHHELIEKFKKNINPNFVTSKIKRNK